MVYRKKYYRKRKKQSNEIDPLAALIAIFLLWAYWIYIKFIEPNLELIKNILNIALPIFIGICILTLIYLVRKKYLQYQANKLKRDNIPTFLLELEEKIKDFKPIRNYKEEKLYQAELTGFLKNNYPELKIEETRHYSRPDIIIDDIAIEIKGPTNMAGLKTLPDKINKYLPKWDYLFIVLFNIQITQDPRKNQQAYEEKKEEIINNILPEKREKVFFIEI